MIKTLGAAACMLLLGAAFSLGCGKASMYAEFEKVLADQLAAQERYMEDIVNVVTPQDLARVIDGLAAQIEVIAPRLSELYKKYPALKSEEKKMPPSVEAIRKRIEANAAQMGHLGETVNARLKIMVNDPAVKKSFERLNEALMLME
ncbi:MAG: hypothetical protein EPN93_20370 [Spirochaetes bacterium]|nr:MAG: hypothetical protein EPN93_20370 [Spirochaetota bacterium]